MPRDSNGVYTLPELPVEGGTLITADWANTTTIDIEAALTDSLSRTGDGSMVEPLLFGDGTVGAPGIAWTLEPTTGFYRAALGDMRVSVLGVDLFRWNAGNTQVWDGAAWANVLVAGEAGSVPDGTVIGQGLVWSGSAWTAAFADAVNVVYDPSGDTILTATDVQGALGETDVVLASYTVHAADDLIHWDDAPIDNVVYNRRNAAWIPSVTGVSAHDQLTGLGAPADDHPQYLNDARGDLRYPAIADYDAHVADTDIHFADAPVDGSSYVRKDAGWTGIPASSAPMVGEIRAFYGLLTALQTGWHLCDGTEGTPDLTGRVPFGAGGAYTEGISAGVTAVNRSTDSAGSHTHTVSNNTGNASSNHQHAPGGSVTVQSGTGATASSFTNTSMQGSDHTHFYSTASTSNGSHNHTFDDADPPHFVVTGWIMYTGVA